MCLSVLSLYVVLLCLMFCSIVYFIDLLSLYIFFWYMNPIASYSSFCFLFAVLGHTSFLTHISLCLYWFINGLSEGLTLFSNRICLMWFLLNTILYVSKAVLLHRLPILLPSLYFQFIHNLLFSKPRSWPLKYLCPLSFIS